MKTILLFLALSLCAIGMTGCCSPCNRCWSGCGTSCNLTCPSSADELGPPAPGMPMR